MEDFQDTAVIYESREDSCWIAHSLRTDQIGTGSSAVEALADLLIAVHQVYELSGKDASIALLREAPAELQRLADKSKPLPKEIYEIAHKMVHGQWPSEDWDLPKPKSNSTPKSFKAELHEHAC